MLRHNHNDNIYMSAQIAKKRVKLSIIENVLYVDIF